MAQFQILRQEGFMLNPNDKVVNGIIKGINRCKGKCPCYHAQEGETPIPDEDLLCPCKQYREEKVCRCNLYVAKEQPIVEAKPSEEFMKEYEQVCLELAAAKAEIAKLNTPKVSSKLVY